MSLKCFQRPVITTTVEREKNFHRRTLTRAPFRLKKDPPPQKRTQQTKKKTQAKAIIFTSSECAVSVFEAR